MIAKSGIDGEDIAGEFLHITLPPLNATLRFL
jgi:hypothetical protein